VAKYDPSCLSKPAKRACGLLAVALLTSCGFFEAPAQLRGNKIEADRLQQLAVGTAGRADATALLGSPTVRSPFDDNVWIYVSETTQPRVGRTPAVLSQETVVLTFDDQGTLRSVERKSLDDSVPVDVVSRTTPSPGTEASFLQQLLGNIGRFNSFGAASAPAGQSGGAPRPY